jgi:hypothetical protein
MHKKSMLAGCAFFGLAVGGFAGPFDTWTYHRDLTVNTTATGANITENLSNFPLLVRLTNTGAATGSDVLATALAGGADVRFTSADGATVYPHEIESWSGSEAILWVKVPVVAGNGSTTVRMYWGKTGEATASNGAGVFDTAAGYVASWHLTGSGNASDATGNGITATNVGTTSASGMIGAGRAFNGSDQYLTVADDPRLDFINPAFTLSAWVLASSWDGGSKRILAKGNGTSSPNTNNAMQYGLRDNSSNNFAIEINGSHHAVTQSPSAGEWHLIHGTFGSGSANVYIDGAVVGTASNAATQMNVTTSELAIGRQATVTTAGNYFGGTMDEVRVQNVTRSSDWIKLEFETQRPGNSTVALGTTQPPVAILPGSRSIRTTTGRSFTYAVPAGSGTVQISVTDAFGRSVWTRLEPLSSNTGRTVTWNGENASGFTSAPGLYLVRLSILNGNTSIRLVEQTVTLSR